jgi:hypothetical protein
VCNIQIRDIRHIGILKSLSDYEDSSHLLVTGYALVEHLAVTEQARPEHDMNEGITLLVLAMSKHHSLDCVEYTVT